MASANSGKLTKLSLGVLLALGLTSVQTVYAQESTSETEEEAVIEKISVTGTRIKRIELSTPAPVLSIDQEEISRLGVPDLGQILSEIPAIGAGNTLIGNNNSNANAGLSAVNLRNLGANRSLVLVNGTRHVAGSPGEATVDTGAIPIGLIQNVDIVTGGRSAVYGSDAVSGVVNIILRDDFEGVQFRANTTQDTESVDYRTHGFSVLAGANSDDGRGNVTFFFAQDNIKEVLLPQLQQTNNFSTYANPDNTGEEDGIPDRLTAPFGGSELINDNTVINPFGGGPLITFNNDGTPIDQVTRQFTNSFAFGIFDQEYDSVYFPENNENYVPEQETITLATTFRYDLTDNIRFYGDAKYVDKEIQQQFQSSFRFGTDSINIAENAFIDPALQTRLLDGGQTTATIARFFGDIGFRTASNDRELFRIVSGFKGDFELSQTVVDYDVFYTYGETTNTRRTLNDLIPGNFTAALDSVIDPDTGEAACRSAVPSAQGADYQSPADVNPGACVPFNPFGFGNSSAAAQDYISGDVTREDSISQEVFGGFVGFDTEEAFSLPGGPIAMVLGFETREEKSRTITDEFTKAGFFTNAATPDADGGYDVDEYYVELLFPILSETFLAERLELEVAYRSADYSHAGNADAWGVGVMWSPISDLTVRATLGESVRAPNITEAFDPQSPGFANINDPCDADNIDNDPDRAANCATLGIGAGFEANDNVSIDVISGGNPDLFSEQSESKTIGFIYEPSYVEGLSVTLDWYDIEITDAIEFLGAQTIIDNCVDGSAGLDPSFCSAVDRNATTNDIELVRSGYINASKRETQGIETQVRYNSDLSAFDLPGEVRVNFAASYLKQLNIFEFQNRPDEINEEVGELGDPEYQFRNTLTYILDDLSVNWTTRYIDRSARFDVTDDIPEDIAPPFIGSIVTHDLQGSYFLTDDIQVSIGLRNMFNKVPSGVTLNPLYDVLGRRIVAGIVYNFE